MIPAAMEGVLEGHCDRHWFAGCEPIFPGVGVICPVAAGVHAVAVESAPATLAGSAESAAELSRTETADSAGFATDSAEGC